MSHNHRVRWGDLVSPRAMYEMTIGDAVGSLPLLFAMAGIFIGCLILAYLVKKLLEYILLPKERHRKYVLDTLEKNGNKIRKKWRKVPVQRYGSIVHIVLEMFFYAAIVIAALFAAATGNVNIWQSAIASVGIGIIGTYIFGPGLQAAGSGIFVFLSNAVECGEYWELVGSGTGGRVSRITPFFVEMMSLGPEGHGQLDRVPMTTILGGNWRRNFYKEAHEPEVVMNEVVVDLPGAKKLPAPQAPAEDAASMLVGEEYEDDMDLEYYEERPKRE